MPVTSCDDQVRSAEAERDDELVCVEGLSMPKQGSHRGRHRLQHVPHLGDDLEAEASCVEL